MNSQANYLPPLYGMDDYENCVNNGNRYCKVGAVLNIPYDNTSLLDYVNAFKENKDYYDRSVIHRYLCTPKEGNNNYFSTQINQEIREYNLTANVTFHVCFDPNYNMSFYDKMILYSTAAFIVFVLLATFYDLFNKNQKLKGILQDFSLYNNFKKRLIIPDYEDFNRMKCMQGFRGLIMFYTIFVHIIFGYTFLVKKNPETFEQLMMWKPMKMISEIGAFILTSFLVMSSWITLIQAHQIVQENGKLTIKYVFIRIFNRYFRFASSIVVVAIFASSLLRYFAGPMNFEFVLMSENVCKENWILNLFLVNNFQSLYDVCNPMSWYISADFQLYVINLILVHCVIKYKLNELKVYIFSLVIWCIIFGCILYHYEVGPIYRPNLRNTVTKDDNVAFSILLTHTLTFSNTASSSVGLIVGYFYLKYKQTTFKPTKLTGLIWLILFIGLPTLSYYLSFCVDTNRLTAAMIGAIVKPMFALGMGIGMLGMSVNIGGKIKKIFELKILFILANFTFATYICQFGIWLVANASTVPNIDLRTILYDFIRIELMTIALGVFVTLAVEEPLNSIQKRLIPQTKTKEIKKKD